MERCDFEGTEIDLPVDLIENPEIISHVLSFDTWKHVLTPEDRNHLKKYFPILPTDYPHAQQENLRALFDGENFKFGNPVETFRRKLQAGHYASDITKYRRQCKAAKYKEYKMKLKKFYRKLVHDVLISRQEIIDKVLSTSLQEAPTITLSWHERQIQKNSSLTGNLETKYKKIIKEVKDECEDHGVSSDEELADPPPPPYLPQSPSQPQRHFHGSNHSVTFYSPSPPEFTSTPTSTPAPVPTLLSTNTSAQNSVTEDDYHRMLCAHKRKRLNKEDYPDLDTHAITLEEIVSRTNVTAKKVPKAAGKKKIKGKDKKEHLRKLKKKRNAATAIPDQTAAPAVVPADNEEQTALVKSNEDSPKVQSYRSLENSSACFFSLLRDIFLDLPDATAELGQLERMVGEWQLSSSCAASAWSFKEPNWVDLIPSALKYLGAGTQGAANNPTFLALVIFKQKVHQWKWIGAYRDKDSDLVPLCEHWFETKDQVMNTVQATSTASGASLNSVKRTDYVVGPSTSDEKSDYQNQERERYENPHKPFIYRMHGFESIVAPVKGVFTKESNLNKAREHSLLVSKRPPYVTILTLVRDAAARLPNGEGTRAEVCQLLKDSQYINPDATDGQIHTVVSGALDRLHYEKDPCVKYDNARKVWIYLHKTRSVEEFEKIHEASAAAARAKKQMSQKQKLIKQQQKAKETALNASPSSSTVEEGENVSMAGGIANVVPPETLPTPKTKKVTKSKRPAASPRKTDKSKVKMKKTSEMTAPSVTGIEQQPHLGSPVLSSLSPLNSLQDTPSLDYREQQEQSMFHNPASAALARTSRLNSPYMGIAQPVLQDNVSFGSENSSYGMKIEGSFDKVALGDGSSSSSSSSESESESESSSEDDGTSGHRSFTHQDTSLHFGEPRMPFSNVMSLGQGNPNGSESDSTFSGYY